MRRAVRLLLVAVAAGGIVFLFVLPGRIWLAQQRDSSVAQRQLRVLSRENAALQKRAGQLQNTGYIAQIARQQYGLVMPGEQAYVIVPLPPTTTTLPPPGRHRH
jgi:cell division protein FtsB